MSGVKGDKEHTEASTTGCQVTFNSPTLPRRRSAASSPAGGREGMLTAGADEAVAVPWRVFPRFKPLPPKKGEKKRDLALSGMDGRSARPERRRLSSSQLKCHRGEKGRGAGDNFSPSGVLSYHFHSWQVPPWVNIERGSEAGGGWDRCWRLLGPSEQTQSVCSRRFLVEMTGYRAVRVPPPGQRIPCSSTGLCLYVISVGANHPNGFPL